MKPHAEESSKVARLTQEAATWRRRLRWTEARLVDVVEVMEEQRLQLVHLWLRDWLTDPTDFDVHVGIEAAIGDNGRVDFTALEAAVQDLLRWKPYLAACVADTSSGSGMLVSTDREGLRGPADRVRFSPVGNALSGQRPSMNTDAVGELL